MTDAEALQMLEGYLLSWYAGRDNIPASKISSGFKVPILRGDDLTRAMIENVDEAKEDVAGTEARLRRAQQDGLFDVEMIRLASKPVKVEWIKVAQVVKGDHERAKAELNHWREYARWSMSRDVTTLPNSQGSGPLVRGLANAKSGDYESPASVPITDEELNAGRRRIEAQIEQWRRVNGATPAAPPAAQERQPGEDDLAEGVPPKQLERQR